MAGRGLVETARAIRERLDQLVQELVSMEEQLKPQGWNRDEVQRRENAHIPVCDAHTDAPCLMENFPKGATTATVVCHCQSSTSLGVSTVKP
jgi:hypothetical protein